MALKLDHNGHWVRAAYRAEDYTPRTHELAYLCTLSVSMEEALRDPKRHLAGYEILREELRDGTRWIVLRERQRGWLAEVAVRATVDHEVHPLPPEWAWKEARLRDLSHAPPIGFLGAPPPGVVDPRLD